MGRQIDQLFGDKCPRSLTSCSPDEYNQKQKTGLTGRDFINSTSYDTGFDLEVNGKNRGPLLAVAIALFGEGSFVSDRLRHPEAYIEPNTKQELAENPALGACVEQAPFVGLLHIPGSTYGHTDVGSSNIGVCVTNSAAQDLYSLQLQCSDYARLFMLDKGGGVYTHGEVTQAFASAIYLANEVWSLSAFQPGFTVNYDHGSDMIVPHISTAGIVLVSILLAACLVCLLCLAVYGSKTPLWTRELDSFAMLRLGGSIFGDVPVKMGKESTVLKEIPGWIGEDASTRELALGARDHLVEDWRYACYTEADVPRLGRKERAD